MRKLFLAVVLVLLAFLFFLDNVAQSARFWEYVIVKAVAFKAKDVQIEDIHIARVERQGVDRVALDAVKIKLKFKNDVYAFSIDQIRLHNVFSLKAYGIKGDFYGGTLEGKAVVRFKPPMSCILDLVLNDIATVQLVKVNAAVFGDVNGIVQGDFHLSAQGERIKSLKAHFHMLPQGTIKAELLQYLAQYLPQRQEIEALIKNNEQVPLDNASVVITSVSDHKFLYNINLYASKLNLKMNVDIDMNMDGNTRDLLRRL